MKTTNKPGTLDQAIILAVQAHAGQLDKCGEPYILHPLRVMGGMGFDADENSRIVAVLHDVVEDTEVKLEHLRSIFDHSIVEAVDAITRRPDETFWTYIERVKENDMARWVKVEDLKDNLHPDRVPIGKESKFESLFRRYQRALDILMEV